MSTYRSLRAAIEDTAVRRALTVEEASMKVMTQIVLNMAPNIPHELLPAMESASRRWGGTGTGTRPSELEEARVRAWKFLKARNGTSVLVKDAVDVAVRALICVLYDSVHEDGDLVDTMEFLADLIDQYRRLGHALVF